MLLWATMSKLDDFEILLMMIPGLCITLSGYNYGIMGGGGVLVKVFTGMFHEKGSKKLPVDTMITSFFSEKLVQK